MPNFTREVRLGIVMYGGVSLAVYENGVSHELFRAVKGLGPYRLLKYLTDSDIVVDIISGTSAGGINGIMLGFALANDRDFRTSAQLWREAGDLGRLLRKLSDESTHSVLDSRGYYQPQLEKAFQEMGPSVTTDAASETGELDLFVTGTNAYGKIWTVFDDQGHPIDVKEHRAIFKLSYRGERKNDFDERLPETPAALAKLSRITSCFPVAFEPVHFREPKPGAHESQADDRLYVWGKLGHSAYFLDGGLLDNKPFTSTLDAIFRRTADRQVERMLFYVEPDPEQFKQVPRSMPDVAQAAISALIGIPGYQSISNDLQIIAQHNDKVIRFWELAESLDAGVGTPPDPAKDQSQFNLYLRCRLAEVRDRAVDGILKNKGQREFLQAKDRKAAQNLVTSFNRWKGPGKQTLDAFDVYFRLRRLTRLVYRIYFILYPKDAAPPPNPQDYQNLWRLLNHQIKVLEILQFVMEDLIDQSHIVNLSADLSTTADTVWEQLQTVLQQLLNPGAIDLPEENLAKPEAGVIARNEFAAAIKKRKDELAANFHANAKLKITPTDSLMAASDRAEGRILDRFRGKTPEVIKEYDQFFFTDSQLFPIEFTANLDGKDIIKTVRISPLDARQGFSRRSLGKLAGAQLGHFGGFLKRSWRSNDILWGRLDGLCQLFECLLTQERLRQVAGRKLPPDVESKVSGILAKLQIDVSPNRLGDLPEDQFKKFQEALIQDVQAEILAEEVPRVVADAIVQQAEWNQYAAPGSTNKDGESKLIWNTGSVQIDPLLTAVSAEHLSRTALSEKKDWAEWFDEGFKVGSEKYGTDIPLPVLLEWTAQAGLVLRKCLLASVGGKNQDRIESSWPYRFLLEYPLWVLYGFARLERRIPRFIRLLAGGVVGVVVVAALVFVAVRLTPAWDLVERIRGDGRVFLAGAAAIVLLVVLWMVGGYLVKRAVRKT